MNAIKETECGGRKMVGLPGGRRVTLGQYVAAWKAARAAPAGAMFTNAFSVLGPQSKDDVLADFRRGAEDRINARGGLMAKDVDGTRLAAKMVAHLPKLSKCAECGCDLPRGTMAGDGKRFYLALGRSAATVMTARGPVFCDGGRRFCCPDCAKAYWN